MKKLIVGFIACVMVLVAVNGYAQQRPPLTSVDVEWAMRTMKAYPMAIRLDVAPHKININHPALAEWCAFVEDRIFVAQSEGYTRLLFNLSLVSLNARLGADETAINTLRACLMADDFAQMLADFDDFIYEM